MEKGWNSLWREFYSTKQSGGKGWRDLKAENKEDFERVYAGDVAEEWKERLGCEVEGREFEGVVKNASGREKEGERGDGVGGGGGKTQKEANEDFFARKGSENEKRRADLPPSQGGKYAGFGSEPPPTARDTGAGGGKGIPGVDEFQKDPVAALTKGFGWFTTTVGKSAKSVNDGWIQPNMQKLAEADLATQARLTAAQVAQNIQTGSKNAAEQFNRFVEDTGSSNPSSTKPKKTVEPEHKDFWDSFGSPAAEDSAGSTTNEKHATVRGGGVSGRNISPVKQAAQGRTSSPATRGRASPAPSAKGNAIGTAAMRKGPKEKEEDKWDDF
ncbi:MAG: hypothetical protein L6R41_006554 [Letrouitia leprolyta]|nr:MAG: hypothetical protein L6R41_006554 [Letrouitia leprolyta]